MKNEKDFFLKLNKVLKNKSKQVHLHEPYINNEELKLIIQSLKKNYISAVGNYLNQFEGMIKKYTKSKYVVCTSSGTAALHVACVIADIKKNDEVLIPNLNYISSANVIKYCHAIPHLIDVSYETLGVDFKKLKEYLKRIIVMKNNFSYNKYTGNRIKAIIPMHCFGHPCEIDRINKLVKSYNIISIEDSAEALGSFYKRKHLGTFSSLGILSFNGNKTITTGAGGAILTSKKNFYLKAKKIINFYKNDHPWKFDYKKIGYNYKMPNLNAALGCAQIKKINFLVNKQRSLYHKYEKTFVNYKFGYIFKEPNNSKSNYWLQNIIFHKEHKMKNLLLKKLNKKKIYVRPAWRLMSDINFLKKSPKMDLKNSIQLFNKILSLPSSANLA